MMVCQKYIRTQESIFSCKGLVQGLLEGRTQREAGAATLAEGSSLGGAAHAALPVPAQAHRRQLPGCCHHQAWRLQEAVC